MKIEKRERKKARKQKKRVVEGKCGHISSTVSESLFRVFRPSACHVIHNTQHGLRWKFPDVGCRMRPIFFTLTNHNFCQPISMISQLFWKLSSLAKFFGGIRQNNPWHIHIDFLSPFSSPKSGGNTIASWLGDRFLVAHLLLSQASSERPYHPDPDLA